MDNTSEGNKSSSPDNRISRRRFLQGAVAGAASTVGIYERKKIADVAHAVRSYVSPEEETSPEVLKEPEMLGFNTNLYAETAVPNDLSLEAFKEDIDTLSQEGLSTIRFSIRPWEIAPDGSENSITWNEEALAVYDEAIRYAKEKGIDVFLVANTPDFAQAYSREDYLEVTKRYFSTLAERYKNDIAILQIFNEPNIHHFRDYSDTFVDAEYLDEFTEIVREVTAEVHAINPNIKTTVNVGGWPLDDNRVDDWTSFFDAIAPYIDILSLDLYPDDNKAEIERLDERVEFFRQRYGKDVIISEIGISTRGGRFSEGDQGKHIAKAIKELKKSNVLGILPYEIRDEARNPSLHERSFGIKDADGSHKESYGKIMGALKPQEQEPPPTSSLQIK